METIISPHKLKKNLIKDGNAYVETIGKFDIPTLQEVLDTVNTGGTVVRLFLGATTDMPLRALSYVASAARVAEHLPCDQLQVISINKLGNRLNKIPIDESRRQSELLCAVGALMISGFMPSLSEKTIFAEDAHIENLDQFIPLVHEVLSYDPKLDQSLRDKGRKHGGDFLEYGAAHVICQDTDSLQLNVISGPEPVTDVKRIVTVGCQQERTFYDLRMGVRALMKEQELVPSAQIFTKHVSPPYYTARHGEQSLSHALENGVNMHEIGDSAAFRDIKHFANSIGVSNE